MTTADVRKLGSAVAACMLAAAAARCAPMPRPETPEILTGSWQWIGSTGGIGGTEITPATQRSAVRYRFDPDGSLTVFRNDSLAERTTFAVGERRGRGGAPTRPVLRYGERVNVVPPPLSEQYIWFRGRDTLVLGDICPDCYQHTFVRAR